MAQRAYVKRTGTDARDFGMALALLVKYFNMPEDYMDTHRVRIYESGLDDVPGPLVIHAAMRATKERTWFPKVNELRLDAETCRREIVAAHPYDGCVECEDKKGWREVIDSKGDKRMERCPCSRRYIAKLAGLGVTTEPLALPPGRASDLSQVSE